MQFIPPNHVEVISRPIGLQFFRPMVLNTKNRMCTTRHYIFNEMVKNVWKRKVVFFVFTSTALNILLNDNNAVVLFTAFLSNTESFLG